MQIPLNNKTPSGKRTMQPMDILKKYDINLQEEMFCQYYTSPTEFFGNGVQSYSAAFDIDISDPHEYRRAKSRTGTLLNKKEITNRLNALLQSAGLNDTHVDKQLLFLIDQSSDFNAKLGAIREYNKLKDRITTNHNVEIINPVARIEIMPVNVTDIETDESD